MEFCKTVEDSERAFKRLETEYKAPFCPLIKLRCDPNCICYKSARMAEVEQNDGRRAWYVYEPDCTNAMFTGFNE